MFLMRRRLITPCIAPPTEGWQMWSAIKTCSAGQSSASEPKTVDRVFSKWRIMLNNQHELIIKGTLECGALARSKPVIRRYSATCVESKFKHKYRLRGNIVDERNELPDYIRDKFYDGFPDDWENVHQIWRTYVNQGCPVMFRWPTTIADSDDDLKSEMTDLTCTHTRPNRNISTVKSFKNEHVKSKNPSVTKPPEDKENYHCYSIRNRQKLAERDCSSAKSFVSDTERAAAPVAQTRSIKLTREEDELSIKMRTACVRRLKQLKNILQEEKFKLIVANLTDKNCSPKYVDKILEMVDRLNYAISYRPGSEQKYASEVPSDTDKSTTIPLEQEIIHYDGHISAENLESELMETKSYVQSTDLGYGSIKNDSNPAQLTNSKASVQLKYNDEKKVEESENEIYVGVPKISMERLLKMRESLGRTHRPRARKKKLVAGQNCAANPQDNAGELQLESAHAIPNSTNAQEILLSDESCVSITEDEIEILDTRERTGQRTTVTREPREAAFSSHQGKNYDIYQENKSVAQKKQLADPSETRVDLNIIKEREILHKTYENAHSGFVSNKSDIEISNDIITINGKNSKEGVQQSRNVIKMDRNSDQNIVISSESNSNPSERLHISRKLRKDFIEQPKVEIPMKKANKPTIISSVPVHLNLKMSNSKTGQLQANSNSRIKKEENQCKNIPPMEEARQKSPVKINSINTKSVTVDLIDCKSTVDNIKQNAPKAKSTYESDGTSSANPLQSTISTRQSTRQSKSSKIPDDAKLLIAWMPQVVHHADSKSELGLIFKGKLLNKLGYVINRNFKTDIVLRRVSPTVIETVNHKFYCLHGCLSDNNHSLPKELVEQCRNGCPAKIKEFCTTWNTLHDKTHIITETSHDVSLDSLSVSVSSRGRRIVPPLCYWTGERVTLKDNILVYNPGTPAQNPIGNRKSEKNSEKAQTPRRNSRRIASMKQSTQNSPELDEVSSTANNQDVILEKTQSSTKSSKTTAKSENVKMQQSTNKRQIVQQLSFSSTDSDEDVNSSRRKSARKTNTDTEPSRRYPMALRKKRYRHADIAMKPKYDPEYCLPTEKSTCKMSCTYYRNIPLVEDMLSENLESPK